MPSNRCVRKGISHSNLSLSFFPSRKSLHQFRKKCFWKTSKPSSPISLVLRAPCPQSMPPIRCLGFLFLFYGLNSLMQSQRHEVSLYLLSISFLLFACICKCKILFLVPTLTCAMALTSITSIPLTPSKDSALTSTLRIHFIASGGALAGAFSKNCVDISNSRTEKKVPFPLSDADSLALEE